MFPRINLSDENMNHRRTFNSKIRSGNYMIDSMFKFSDRIAL